MGSNSSGQKKDPFVGFPSLPTTEWWRELARPMILERYGTAAKYAEHMGTSEATISNVLSGKHSKAVIPISRDLEIPAPFIEAADAIHAEVMAMLNRPDVGMEALDLIVGLLRYGASAKKS